MAASTARHASVTISSARERTMKTERFVEVGGGRWTGGIKKEEKGSKNLRNALMELCSKRKNFCGRNILWAGFSWLRVVHCKYCHYYFITTNFHG